MAVTFDANELEGMKRAELQKLCKSVGIRANSKVSVQACNIYCVLEIDLKTITYAVPLSFK